MGHVVKGFGHVVPGVVMDARAEAAAIVDVARREADALRARAEREGRDEGRARAAAELAGLLIAGRAEVEAMRAHLEPAALALATKMAEKIVGRAVDLAPATMAAIAAEAVAACRTRGGGVLLRVHPDDLASALAARSTLDAGLEGDGTLELVADESVGRYGCIVDTALGRVDARLDTQLAALRRALASDDTDVPAQEPRG
jgi:flagellar biosynthesis/type III secretory pathway protein FliH